MAKHWALYKSEITALYITNGRSLEEVRRILKGRHNFDASAYRMKLEEWGLKKNKVTVNIGTRRPFYRSSKKAIKKPSSHRAIASSRASAVIENSNISSFPSDPDVRLQNHEFWGPNLDNLNFSDSHDESFNSSSLNIPEISRNHLGGQYIHSAREDNFASHQSLFVAISINQEGDVENLLSSGAPVNIRDNINNTPLHSAISNGNIVVVKALLKYGANVNAVGFKGKTPLHLAVDSPSLLQLLLRHQPALSLQDDQGNTVLHDLLDKEDWWNNVDAKRTIKSILSAGADVNIKNRLNESPLDRVITDTRHYSELYMEIVLEFLNHKPNVTLPMRDGLALLTVFLDKSRLLSHKYSYRRWKINWRDWTSVGFQCLEQFLNAGADPNMVPHTKPLIIEYLLNAEFPENSPSEKFLVHLLQTADIEISGPAANYPLHLSLARYRPNKRKRDWAFGNYAVTAALISRNADVNQTNDSGASPLEIWLDTGKHRRSGVVEVALLLVEAGAETTKSTSTSKTLFDMLSYLSSDDQIRLNKAFLKADIKFQQNDNDVVERSKWVQLWRWACKERRWHLAKFHLNELQYTPSRPKTTHFMECASLVTMENLLEKHRSRLQLWLKDDLDRGSVVEDYDDYCAILGDCRKREVEIDVSWYTFLLDIMDFK